MDSTSPVRLTGLSERGIVRVVPVERVQHDSTDHLTLMIVSRRSAAGTEQGAKETLEGFRRSVEAGRDRPRY